jgi:hypothetical protein
MKIKKFIYKNIIVRNVRKYFSNFKKFDQDESENISPSEKYKDFRLDNLKTYSENVRKEQQFFNQKMQQYEKLGPIEIKKIGRSLFNRNFLNKKPLERHEKAEIEKNEELKSFNLDDLKKLSLTEPITMYEISESFFQLIRTTQKFFLIYLLMNFPFSFYILTSYKAIFLKTTIAYGTVYAMNFLTCLACLLNYKIKKSTVIELLYDNKDESIIIRTFRSVFNMGVKEVRYKLDELEYIESNKLLESEFVLRVKRNKKVVYCFVDDGLWFHKDILSKLI